MSKPPGGHGDMRYGGTCRGGEGLRACAFDVWHPMQMRPLQYPVGGDALS